MFSLKKPKSYCSIKILNSTVPLTYLKLQPSLFFHQQICQSLQFPSSILIRNIEFLFDIFYFCVYSVVVLHFSQEFLSKLQVVWLKSFSYFPKIINIYLFVTIIERIMWFKSFYFFKIVRNNKKRLIIKKEKLTFNYSILKYFKKPKNNRKTLNYLKKFKNKIK